MTGDEMNYYERFCGDYMRDTAHLSLMEHGVYTVLLDTYYATEKPLPSDLVPLYRICRAMSEAEQEAVRNVVEQFFPVAVDGLRHNERADRVIDAARGRIEAARENGRGGGRPRKNPVGSTEKPSGVPSVKADEKLTRPHTPKNKNLNPLGDASAARFDEAWASLPKRAGNNPKGEAHKAWNARLRDGFDPQAMIDGAKRYAAWVKNTGKEHTEFVMRGSTFFGPAHPFDQEWEKPAENGKAKPWYIASASAIESKARELGLDPSAMPFPQLRIAAFRAAGITPEMVSQAEQDFR